MNVFGFSGTGLRYAARLRLQNAQHGFPNVGVQMHWINKIHIGKSNGQFCDRTANRLESFAEVLASMPGNQNQAARTRTAVTGLRGRVAPLRLQMLRQAGDAWRSLADFLQSQKQSGDYGIARNEYF